MPQDTTYLLKYIHIYGSLDSNTNNKRWSCHEPFTVYILAVWKTIEEGKATSLPEETETEKERMLLESFVWKKYIEIWSELRSEIISIHTPPAKNNENIGQLWIYIFNAKC